MTLGEFRKYTESLDDSIELLYHHSGGYFSINTMELAGKEKLVLCAKAYGEDNIVNILKTIAFLKQKS